jgi:hypothetical protein
MGINLLEIVKQKLPFTEDEARQLLVTTTKQIMRDWPQGALIASQGTPLFTAYRQASDAVDAAFDGSREQFLAALQRYETALMRIKEEFKKNNGQRIHQP